MSLKQIIKKIKGLINSYLNGLVIILLIFLGFVDIYLIGILSNNLNSQNFDLKIKKNSDFSINLVEIKGDDDIFASKNGTKYYFSWCGSTSRISQENKIFFKSEEEAIKAGYELAKNCQKK